MFDRDEAEKIAAPGAIRRRRVLGLGAGAVGAAVAMPMVWQRAFGAAKPYKIGTEQPLTGVAALGGKTALIGLQMAVDRINKNGGILGRPVELIVADDQSKPDTGRRAVEKLVTEDEIDAHVGGYLSNICLACVPVFVEHKVVNMISVCLDTTLTTTHCNKYTFRPYDFAPGQAKAFTPYMVNKIGKRWFIAYVDYAWGQSTRDAYANGIKANGGSVVGTLGIPLGTPDMTPFLSKISGNFDALFFIFFGSDAIHIINQGYDLGLHKKYKWAGDGAMASASQLPAMGNKIEGFIGIDRYVPVFKPAALNTPYLHAFYNEAVPRLKKAGLTNPLPDRYVQSNFEAMNCLKLGIEKSKFQGRADSDKLIAALEGLHMKASYDFPTGDKILRKADHQAFVEEVVFTMKGGTYQVHEIVPWQKTVVPPACTLSA
jgi:branched-chain amino acid transport system substrate-binding protein